MSDAVKYVLESFKNVDKKCFDNYGFVHELSGFIHALEIRQGDYKIVGLSKDSLTVEFLDEKTSFYDKFDKKAYTKEMLELLNNAIEKDPYEIKVNDIFENVLEETRKIGNEEEIKKWEKIAENVPPSFEFYSKSHKKLLASLLGNVFTLSSKFYPEATYLMEKIGRRAFECKKGKLNINVNPENFNGIKNMEEWRKELLNWKT